MQTYLQLHQENTGIPQAQFRGRYPLRHMDYEFDRAVDRKGEAASDIRGGEIRVAIGGFADHTLLWWLFDPTRKEDGEIVMLNEYEQTFAKFRFLKASAVQFRLNYDSRLKESVCTILTIRGLQQREYRRYRELPQGSRPPVFLPEAKTWLANRGFDPKYGARQVAGTIRNYIRRPISRMIIGGETAAGNTICIEAVPDGEIKWNVK